MGGDEFVIVVPHHPGCSAGKTAMFNANRIGLELKSADGKDLAQVAWRFSR